MRHEPPEMDDDDDDEFDTIYAESVLGASGITVGADGIACPLPMHEAIAHAIPHWVLLPEHESDTLEACLEFAVHDHPAVRAAATAAFGDLARRYGRLAERGRERSSSAYATATTTCEPPRLDRLTSSR
jgi:hypothetical protein